MFLKISECQEEIFEGFFQGVVTVTTADYLLY